MERLVRRSLLRAVVGLLLAMGAPHHTSADASRASSVVSVDDFGAAGDGRSDDSAAFLAAAYSLKSGGVVQLTCGRKYYIAKSITIGRPGVSIKGCWRFPQIMPRARNGDLRFLGGLDDVGKIIRAPDATISIGDGGGLDELAIIQRDVSPPMADTTHYSGVAVALNPGGNGVSAHMNEVLIIGGQKCFDGHLGGSWVRLLHVAVDCVNGIDDIGQSAGSSVYDDVDAGVFGTQEFDGYPITSVVGDGKTTTVTYEDPRSIDRPTAFELGDIVSLPTTAVADGTPYSDVYGYTIVAARQTGRTGSVSFRHTHDTRSSRVISLGALQNVSRQYRRAGTGISFGDPGRATGCDDTHIGRMAEFGFRVGIDIQCNGIASFDHLWIDNSSDVGLRIGSLSHSVVELHFNSVYVAGIGGIGVQINGSGLMQSTAMIDKLSIYGKNGDCVGLNGVLQFSMAHLQGCAGYGVNVGANSKLYGDSLWAQDIGHQVFAPGSADGNIKVSHVFTDLKPGGSLYGGVAKQTTVLESAVALHLPATAIGETLETYAVSGNARISLIDSCWANRALRLILSGRAKLAKGGNIAFEAGGMPGTVVRLVCDASTDPRAPVWRRDQ